MSINNIPGPEGVRGRNSDNTLYKKKMGGAPSQSLRVGMEQTYAWIQKEAEEKLKVLNTTKDKLFSII